MFSNEMIGGKIRGRREKLGLKQSDIGNALQISSQAVSKWERGENAPDIGILTSLARVLGTTTDWLLGYDTEYHDVFEATVFFSSSEGFTRRTEKMDVRDVADIVNALLFQITEAVLRFGGVPVKNLGDGLMAFFSGSRHRIRAVRSAVKARQNIDTPISVGLNSGQVYLGSIGHPDYACPDIMGDSVNLAARTLGWAGKTDSGIVATDNLVKELEEPYVMSKIENVTVKGKTEPVTMYQVVLPSG